MAGRTDTASRTLSASPGAVYAALMDPARLVQWLPPNDMTGEITAFEPRKGGHFRMILRYADPAYAGKSGGNEDIVEATFADLVENQLVVWATELVSDDPDLAGTMLMNWIITPEGAGSLVTIRADNVPPGISAADHQEGLNASLDNLVAFLA